MGGNKSYSEILLDSYLLFKTHQHHLIIAKPIEVEVTFITKEHEKINTIIQFESKIIDSTQKNISLDGGTKEVTFSTISNNYGEMVSEDANVIAIETSSHHWSTYHTLWQTLTNK